jgi:putative endonuclease
VTPEPGRASDGGRRRALGARGEELAAREYERLGYRRLAVALRTRAGEIDVLVRRGRLYVAAEVKTRGSAPCPEEAVDAARNARLRRALWLLAPALDPPPRSLRIDVVAVRIPPGGAPPAIRIFTGEVYDPPRA